MPTITPLTSFLPLSTPYPSNALCSTLLYGVTPNTTLIAYDPQSPAAGSLGGVQPSTARKCLPDAWTSSYLQSRGGATTMLLGGSRGFACPEDYESVGDTGVDDGDGGQMLMSMCCPRNYNLATILTGIINIYGFPSQCTSSFTSGQTITYPYCFSTGGPSQSCPMITETVTALRTVYAWHINGFNLATTTTSSISSSSTSTMTSSVDSIVKATSCTTSTTTGEGSGVSNQTIAGQRVSTSKQALSTPATVGIAICCSVLTLAFLVAAVLIWQRWKRKRDENSDYTTSARERKGSKGLSALFEMPS